MRWTVCWLTGLAMDWTVKSIRCSLPLSQFSICLATAVLDSRMLSPACVRSTVRTWLTWAKDNRLVVINNTQAAARLTLYRIFIKTPREIVKAVITFRG